MFHSVFRILRFRLPGLLSYQILYLCIFNSYHQKALEDVQNLSEKLHAILVSIGKVRTRLQATVILRRWSGGSSRVGVN